MPDPLEALCLDRLSPLLPSYQVPSGHYDELLTGDRRPRPTWAGFASHAGPLGPDALTHAQERIARQIHENGVTYNVYAAAEGQSRPWMLDVLPMMIGGEEWDRLSFGLRQRARLLDALAADLYGPQTVLHRGLLPPGLVLRHPGFLRACHGAVPPGGVFLHLVAFDLARGPDGDWRVVGTRTQAPSGIGYALENRTTISRLFPDAFRALNVPPLSPFVRSLQRALLANAPCEGETPHVLLLTPGPYSETYFEHAGLARALGFRLVEGGDLTVRHDRVFLKTVSGLHRVHAILRRLDDDFCDPLELRSDSTLGVPGLVQAWRAGHVLIANAFGMGVLESAALHPFLPSICEALLNDRLQTPALTTAWTGAQDAGHATGVLMATGVIKPAFPDLTMDPVFVADLDEAGKAEWAARLAATPELYIVEEFVPLSHAPVWDGARLESRAAMLRVFLVTDGEGDYRVMPGGLSRIAGASRHIVSGQRGGGSKDTWILSGSPVDPEPLDRRALPRGTARPDVTISSRVAEHLYWLGRYAERSENCARSLRAMLSRLTDTGELPNALRHVFVRASLRQGLLDSQGAGASRTATFELPTGAIERGLLDGLFDEQTHQSLAFNVRHTVRVAGTVRDRLSSDNWRVLNRLSQSIASGASDHLDLDETLELLDRCLVSLVAVGGLEMAHMTRDDGWRFLSLGRHLERLSFIGSSLEDVTSEGASDEPSVLEWLLDLSDSLMAYRSRYMRPPEWPTVAELLLFDPRNPRSASFQLAKLAKHVRLLPDAELVAVASEIDELHRLCSASDSTQGMLFGGAGTVEALLSGCQRLSLRLSDALTLRYLSHVYDVPRAMMGG